MVAIASGSLEEWTHSVLTAAGVTDDIAASVAQSLVSADLRGHGLHGVRLLPKYLDRIDPGAEGPANRIDPAARPVVEEESGPLALVEGGAAFGRLVGRDATALAVEASETHGVGVVGIRDGNHVGRMGEWAERAANEGVLLFGFVKGEANLIAPVGTAERWLSTNPLVAGIPTFDALEFPLVLDAATSVTAGGKVWERARAGRDLPVRWAIDGDGEPVRSAERFLDGDGALQPLGGSPAGHKGFGLAVVAELFGAILGDGAVAGQREHVHFNNTAMLVAIGPMWFTTEEAIAERVRILAAHLRSARPVPDSAHRTSDGVLLPGEPEHRAERRARRSGVDLPPETVTDPNECARSLDHGPLIPV